MYDRESSIPSDFISRENVRFALLDVLHPVPDVGGLPLDDLQLPGHWNIIYYMVNFNNSFES